MNDSLNNFSDFLSSNGIINLLNISSYLIFQTSNNLLLLSELVSNQLERNMLKTRT